jgi:tetratricopeptide (TPR) repeat protein
MKKIVFIIIISFVAVQANPLNITQMDKDINAFLFNGQWEKADSLIEIGLKAHPNHPKYYFMKAYNYNYARFFSNTSADRATTIRQIEKYAWEAILVGEELEEDLETNFYLGCAYGYLARANTMRQETWQAYWNASKSENYLEDVLDEDPNVYDAYLGLGLIEYAPDIFVTGFSSVLTWLGGMSGDRELGQEYFKNVSDKGVLFKDEAKLILGVTNSTWENSPEIALNYYSDLADRYQDNNLFQLQKSRLRFIVLIDEKGAEYLEDEIENLVEEYDINNANILNALGYYFMNPNLGRLDDALIVFRTNIKLYPHVANCYDSMAECYMNRNENENAIKYYEMAFEKLDADTTIDDQFREALKESIPERLEELRNRVAA